MSLNISSDTSNGDSILAATVEELLVALEKVRKLEDLVTSLKAQKAIIEALLILVE